MTLLAEADKILQKASLTIKDYNRFVEIGKAKIIMQELFGVRL